MKSNTHTSGEWKVADRYSNVPGWPIYSKVHGKRKPIAYINDELPTDEVQANAKLIASAPRLLEALRDIVQADKMNMGKKAKDLRLDIAADLIDSLATE